MKKMLLLVVLTIISLTVLAEDRAEKLRENLFHNPKYVTVVAHRGDWRNHPENSLPAFQSCIEMGVDMIEIDLQRTKDGELILMHDRTVDRCTNGKGKISEMTYDEIQRLRLRPQHSASITRNHIPTLEEVLNLCKGKILINIDKGYDYFQQVYELMEKTGTTNQVIIKSGHSLEKIRKENGTVLSKVIYMPIVNLNSEDAEARIDEFITIHPVAVECCIDKYNQNVERLLQKLRDAGIKIWINSIWASLCDGHDDDRAVELGEPNESWGWILDRGATLIQSDRPRELLQYLKKNKRHKLK
ncbi:MAG: glycerophosphodiester phosphodiesterase family protein [Bacteroidaceae bacterium]|nr:glycerophosphodiester phosphodiesterase family protein [Bacteroidaceae bacterium]MBR4527015.1 glycerophosphodiester phosphodiesterase family protein [Bacteroidaceae bacterium]